MSGQSSTVTSGFIDLATFDEIEKYLYGGPDATAYFVRETRKSTWFTQVPVVLSRAAGNPGSAKTGLLVYPALVITSYNHGFA